MGPDWNFENTESAHHTTFPVRGARGTVFPGNNIGAPEFLCVFCTQREGFPSLIAAVRLRPRRRRACLSPGGARGAACRPPASGTRRGCSRASESSEESGPLLRSVLPSVTGGTAGRVSAAEGARDAGRPRRAPPAPGFPCSFMFPADSALRFPLSREVSFAINVPRSHPSRPVILGPCGPSPLSLSHDGALVP